MHVDTAGIALFLHLASVVAGMMLAAVMHTALIQMRRSTTVAEMRPWTPVLHRVEPVLPVTALAALATGAWLVHLSDGEFSWGQGWLLTSLIGLVIAETFGAALAPRSGALTRAVAEAADGPISAELQQRAQDPVLWFGSHLVTATFFGIIFLMSTKPAGAWAPIVVLVIAAMVGLALAALLARQKAAAGPRSRHAHQHG
jgi:uncharacterized membrane protein